MKLLAKIFGGRKNVMPSIAQIIITVVILPILCYIMSLIVGGDNAFSIISDFLDELSITQYWMNLLLSVKDGTNELSGLDVYSKSIDFIYITVIQTCIVGMCISLCKNLGIFFQIKGVPLLQSLLGVFFGCIIVNAFGLKNDLLSLYACAFLIILNMAVIWLFPKGPIGSKIGAILVGLGLQIIVAALSAGYVVFLSLIIEGAITDFMIAIRILFALFIPLRIVLFVDYIFFTPFSDSLDLELKNVMTKFKN